MKLRLINTVTKQQTELSVLAEIKGQFADITLTLPTIDAGEYEYELIDNHKVIGQGMAQIGEIKADNDQYNNEVKYIQYNG